jgi:hypothetical protein
LEGPSGAYRPEGGFHTFAEALTGKTNCGLYAIYLGCVGFCINRTVTTLDQRISHLLVEQIFCYQFDWRYAKTFGITINQVDDKKDRVTAIRRSVAYYFFEVVESMPSFFQSNSPLAETSFMINFTRHLLGEKNVSIFDDWVARMIARMDEIAKFTETPSPSIHDYPSRRDWEEQVLRVHGTPLPLEVLDPEFDLKGRDLRALAIAQLNSINPTENPLLATPELLHERGFTGTPYRLAS